MNQAERLIDDMELVIGDMDKEIKSLIEDMETLCASLIEQKEASVASLLTNVENESGNELTYRMGLAFGKFQVSRDIGQKLHEILEKHEKGGGEQSG